MADCLSELSPAEFKRLLNGLALISQIYWGPTPELCAELTGPAVVEEVMQLSGVLGSSSESAAQNILAYLRRIENPGILHDTLESAYISLFVNHKGGVAAPLYQSFYEGDGVLMGRPAIMMQQRLDQMGIDLAQKTGEPPDHLSVELEYLYLVLESAYMHDDPSLLSQAREFASTELLSWVELFRTRIPDHDDANRMYGAVTDLLLSILKLTSGCA